MTIKATAREQVRQRANFACEFCGISETDAGGQQRRFTLPTRAVL
jgi:hypothetical protein